MLRSPTSRVVVAACAAAVAACGGGDPALDAAAPAATATAAATAPTADEARSVVKTFLPHFVVGLPESTPFSIERPCPAGGTARAKGSFTVEPATTHLVFVHEQRLQACADRIGKGGDEVWKIDVPGMRTTTTYRLQGEAFAFEMKVLGATTLSNGARSHRCDWDLTVDGTLTGPSAEMRARGRSCGHAVDVPIVVSGMPG